MAAPLTATVTLEDARLNIRSGPDTDYKVLAKAEAGLGDIEGIVAKAVSRAENCHEAYLAAGPQLRKQMNQAFFTRILVTEAEFDTAFRALDPAWGAAAPATPTSHVVCHRRGGWAGPKTPRKERATGVRTNGVPAHLHNRRGDACVACPAGRETRRPSATPFRLHDAASKAIAVCVSVAPHLARSAS